MDWEGSDGQLELMRLTKESERESGGVRFIVDLLIVLGLLFLFASAAKAEPLTYQEAAQSVVFVYNREGSCTGVIVADGLILTNAHCFHKKGVYVNATALVDVVAAAKDKTSPDKAEVIARDEGVDLMLLRDNRFKAVRPAVFARPELDEEVLDVSYAQGFYHVNRARITRITPSEVFLDRNFMRGASGSAIWNMKGECVGIVNSFDADSSKQLISTGMGAAQIPLIFETYMIAIHPNIVYTFVTKALAKQVVQVSK